MRRNRTRCVFYHEERMTEKKTLSSTFHQSLKGGAAMIRIMQKKVNTLISAGLILFLLVLLISPSELSAGVCEKAFIKCLIDASFGMLLGIVAGFVAGNIPGALLGVAAVGGTSLVWCLAGYDFCIHYFQI